MFKRNGDGKLVVNWGVMIPALILVVFIVLAAFGLAKSFRNAEPPTVEAKATPTLEIAGPVENSAEAPVVLAESTPVPAVAELEGEVAELEVEVAALEDDLELATGATVSYLEDNSFDFEEGELVQLGAGENECGYNAVDTLVYVQDSGEYNNDAVHFMPVSGHPAGDDKDFNLWYLPEILEGLGIDSTDVTQLGSYYISAEAVNFALATDVRVDSDMAVMKGVVEEWNAGVTVTVNLLTLHEDYGGLEWLAMRMGEFRVVHEDYIQGHQALRVRHLTCRGKLDNDGTPRDVHFVNAPGAADIFADATFEYILVTP